MEKKSSNRTGNSSKNRKPAQKKPVSRDEERRAHAAARRRKNKRKQIFTWVLLFILLLGAGAALVLTVFFKITTVAVEGKTQYSESAVIEASGIAMGGNLFTLNKEAAEKNIEEKLPFVGEATVKFQIPDTVIIYTEPAKPACAVKGESGYILIDKNAKVLETVEKPSENIPVIKFSGVVSAKAGMTLEIEDKTAFEGLSSLITAAESAGLNIQSYDMSDTFDVKIICENGNIVLKLGKISEKTIERKLKLAAESIRREKNSDPEVKGTFDLTYDGKAYFSPAH